MTALDQDSSVTLRTMLVLPDGTFRAFMVASVMSSWVPVSGRPGPIRTGERAVAFYLSRAERKRACERIGISEKTWHNYATEWVRLRLAHRCSHGTITLFANQLNGDAAICPRCRGSLLTESDLPATREHPSRHTGTSASGTEAATSGNEVSPNKVELQGGEEGGPGLGEITPEVAKEISDAQALDNLRSSGLIREEAG